jgi:hypothetical protein
MAFELSVPFAEKLAWSAPSAAMRLEPSRLALAP